MPTGPFVRCPERLHRPPAFLRCRPLPLHRRRQLLLVHAAEVLHGVLVLLQDRAKLRPHALHLRRTSVAQASHKCHTHGDKTVTQGLLYLLQGGGLLLLGLARLRLRRLPP
eukprot:8589591-Pyramimonas_sp.AAC.1